MKLIIFATLVLGLTSCDAYQMTECQLLSALRQNGFPEHQMRDWMCLVNHESSRRTDKIGPPNHDGSRDYGLFQINDKYWCSNTSTPGKECNVTCADLLTDDITKAATCAMKIFKIHGFKAWYAWKNKCQNNLPLLPEC